MAKYWVLDLPNISIISSPISIIPVVAKVFERILYNQFYEYLTENNLISCNQSRFRSLHSTATALLEATDNWAFNTRPIKIMLMQ